MKKDDSDTSRFGDLRHQAEEILKKKKADEIKSIDEAEIRSMVHELQVHQIELEMQNEELQRAYHTAEEMSDQYVELFDFAPVGYFTFNEDVDSILMVNLFGAAMLGMDRKSLIGKRMAHFITPEFRGVFNDFVKNTLQSDEKQTCEVQLLKHDGTPFYAQMEGIAIEKEFPSRKEIRVSLIDITGRKLADEELEQMHKLESLGILAGGIAHDFNNLLAAILGYVSLSKMHINSEDKIYTWMENAEKATLKAKGLTQQLLTFSKGGTPVKKGVPFAKLLKSSVDFTLSGSTVRAEFSIPDDIWSAYADENQISQVISNLVMNAIQVMPERGTIRAGCENIVIQEGNPMPLKQGNYVKITIRDTGSGIAEEHLKKIFDPFFTTKEKGRGLGLSICYSIIKRHDGYITFESKQGVGTTVYLYLPAMLEKVEKEEKEKKLLSGNGRVLLMDDEKVIIELTSYMLKILGYEVESGGDGAEAIEKYRIAKDAGKPFDAVILDLTVPGGMGGKETIIRLKKMNPAVRAIVSSGYSNDPVIANCEDYGFMGALPKPYSMADLSEVLHKVMTGRDE